MSSIWNSRVDATEYVSGLPLRTRSDGRFRSRCHWCPSPDQLGQGVPGDLRLLRCHRRPVRTLRRRHRRRRCGWWHSSNRSRNSSQNSVSAEYPDKGKKVEQFFKYNFFKGNTSKTAILMMLQHISIHYQLFVGWYAVNGCQICTFVNVFDNCGSNQFASPIFIVLELENFSAIYKQRLAWEKLHCK